MTINVESFTAKPFTIIRRTYAFKFPMNHEVDQNMSILCVASVNCVVIAIVSFMGSMPANPSSKSCSSSSTSISTLKTLDLYGHLRFDNVELDHAARDFGNSHHHRPNAVLRPKSVSDISSMIKHIYEMGSSSKLTVAAKGRGHSIHGQAQASQGIVVHMESLKDREMVIRAGDNPYVDASGGELWIDVLRETLALGLTPKSWTDYLHLTIGGTLSNAGISGQAFRHGPQIDNVLQLEVVTGKGEVIVCSKEQEAELFYSVLGGLGQFGIITRARISLGPAPTKVKWIRVLYEGFAQFAKDQERLIATSTVDYVEGFVVSNGNKTLTNWRSSFAAVDPIKAAKFAPNRKTLYCLEIGKYSYNDDLQDFKEITWMLSELNFIPSTLFVAYVSYEEFLDRVHSSEKKLRSKGLWDLPHPWMNLLIPKSAIHEFAVHVFENLLNNDSHEGPMLVYPVNKSSWNDRTFFVTPEEDVMYLVALLPSSSESNGLEYIRNQNNNILSFCSSRDLGVKQYLPHYHTNDEWKVHFGSRWEHFERSKMCFDPLAILAPGQNIFRRQ